MGFLWSAGSSPAVRTIAALLALAGCNQRPDSGAVIVSAIGPAPRAADPARVSLDTPTRLLLDATAQGLVRFDATGQIEPGLAERWIVIDDGTSYIFRLRPAQWADGSTVTAEQVVALLRRQLRPGSRNPLAPFLTAVDEIVVMTPQVIEVRLRRPRPDLLKVFAQPELALWRARAGGTGPLRIARGSASPLLRPALDPGRADLDDQRTPGPEENVRLIGERAARAIVRFAAHDSDLVAGGTFTDWPLVGIGGIAPANIRIDPAAGLFGLSIERRTGFLADAANRSALSGAIDRGAATAAVMGGWDTADRLLPEQLDSAAPPALPSWSLLTLDQRREAARTRVAAYADGPVTLAVAVPTGPGGTLLYAGIAASLTEIGITARRVGPDEAADLRLVDLVAPYDSARWYLAQACRPCSPDAEAAILAARDAPTLAERARLIAAADVALANDAAFIPLARPLRWSLVAMRLRQWRPNSRAWHPLNRLRDDTR
ncbi:ABC transporter substrate-binding protein [Sphingomonas sp. MA1305]|nr:ABC transporter substrate-binding protein [Sphingomonas sp. MA1305]